MFFLPIVITLIAYGLAKNADIEVINQSKAKLLVSMSAAFLNLICIVILNQLYERLALWLTNYERPRQGVFYDKKSCLISTLDDLKSYNLRETIRYP